MDQPNYVGVDSELISYFVMCNTPQPPIKVNKSNDEKNVLMTHIYSDKARPLSLNSKVFSGA